MRLLQYFIFVFFFGFSGLAFAHHGPEGACGCGACGIQKKLGNDGDNQKWVLSYGYNRTQFENLSDAEIFDKTMSRNFGGTKHFHLDAIEWASIHQVELGVQAMEMLWLSASTGYYHAENVREGHADEDEGFELHHHDNVDGMTDLWLQAAYTLSLQETHPTLCAGVKFPTGKGDVPVADEQAPFEPASQPSSGAYDYLLGLAISGSVNESWNWKANTQVVLKTKHSDVKIGDTLELGGSVWCALPRYVQSLGVESWVVKRMKNEEAGAKEDDTGGLSWFAAPMMKISLAKSLTLQGSFGIPLSQNLNGAQQKVDSVSKFFAQWNW